MLKCLGKGITLISCDVTFWFYYCSFFYSSEDYQEFNMAKSKVLAFKIARNWQGFPLQTRYLVKKLSLHVVVIMSNVYIGSGLVAW